MNTKNNKLYQDTEQALIHALLELSDSKEMIQITVSDICRVSHTNRSTFYAHFQDIPDMLEQIDATMRKKLMKTFPSDDYKTIYASGEFIRPFLSFIKENQKFYRACLIGRTSFPIKHGYEQLMNLVVKPICLERGITSERQMFYSLTYIQAGFTSILRNWVLAGCVDSVDNIETYIKTCMPLLKHD